jgi:hypothetical protein
VRIPEKWAHLAPAPPGSAIATPINFVDFPPTVLSLARVAAPRYMQGRAFLGRSRRKHAYAFGQRSRMDERYDLQRTVRDERYVYIRNYMPHRAYGQHVAFMWGQKGYREWEQGHVDHQLTPLQERFWQEKPSEELYDVRTDPDELHDGFIKSLGDGNEVVRYWAVQGIVMLGDAGRPAFAGLGERLDNDPSVHVRIAAAEALARLGNTGRPLAFLVETLDTHDDVRVRLLALDALTYLPVDALRPYGDVILRAATSPDEYVAGGARYLSAVVAGTYDPLMPP